MRAIILAAGQGTRLRPLTDDCPKCMVPLAGISLLERQKVVLQSAGLMDITVVAGYRSDRIPPDGVSIVINPRYAETNMVATLFCATEALRGDQDVVISYGDIVYEPRVLQAVLDSPAPFALAIDKNWRAYWELRQENPLNDAETLKLNETGHVLELGKKPKDFSEIQGQYMGLFKIRADRLPELRRVYDAMDRKAPYNGKDFDNLFMTSFIQFLIDAGWVVQSVPVSGGWLEVDTVEDLQLYENMARDGRLDPFYKLDAKPQSNHDVAALLSRLAADDALLREHEVLQALDRICRKIDINKKLYAVYEADWKKPTGEALLPAAAWPDLITLLLKAAEFIVFDTGAPDTETVRGEALKLINTAYNALNLYTDAEQVAALGVRIDDLLARLMRDKMVVR